MIPDMLAGPVQGTLPLYSSTCAAMHSGGGSFRLANGSLAGVTGLQEGSDCLPWSLCNPSGSRYLPAAIASEPHRLGFHDVVLTTRSRSDYKPDWPAPHCTAN